MARFGDRCKGTPNLGFGMSDGGAREHRVGWRLTSAVGEALADDPLGPYFSRHHHAT